LAGATCSVDLCSSSADAARSQKPLSVTCEDSTAVVVAVVVADGVVAAGGRLPSCRYRIRQTLGQRSTLHEEAEVAVVVAVAAEGLVETTETLA